MRRLSCLLLILSFSFSSTLVSAAEPAAGIVGFAPERVAAQRAAEARFDAALSTEDLKTWMHQIAGRPHHLGSPHGASNAEYMAGLFRSWGYETRIEEFWVLFPTPKERLLEMVAPTRFRASLVEAPIPEDSTSGQTREQLPTYNAYSVDGDVTGEVVYVNYGLPADYEELAKRGVSVEGKIALARYGRSWRGIKPKVAAEHGAIGCLIYNDPAEDGYGAGDMYPKGGWRAADSVQRGSVADMPVHSGDPLTPGVGAVKEAKRLERSEAKTLTKIPVLPISARDAQPILAALGGQIVPAEWRGALPLAYHFGPGPAKVHLKLAFNWDLAPAKDVIAVLRGSERPDQWVVRGNHHDAWVNGASDPVSGLVSELAEAKALGELVKSGYRPKRTIVFAAWDGEEPGLLGSTEWVETHAAELGEKAVAYINSDGYERGIFTGGGSHALEPLVREVMAEVKDPLTGDSLAARERAFRSFYSPPDETKRALAGEPMRLGALGSGSDFTPFFQHLGVAALNLNTGGEGEYGQYHSIFDSIDHFERFVDPGYRYGVTNAQANGRLLLRLADADVLPFEPRNLVDTLGRYAKEVQELLDSKRSETERENRLIEERLYAMAADPTRTFVVPAKKDTVPFVNFAPLQNAVAKLEASVAAMEKARAARQAAARPLATAEQIELDGVLAGLERSMTRREGLPGRPWYQHYLYAPGFYTGYGVKTMPSVREAIELRKWEEAGSEIEVLSGVLGNLAAQIDRATAIWQR